MKAKLTFWEKVNMFFGFGYLANIGTGEIHRLANKKATCRLHMITNKMYVSKKRALKLMETGKGYNGCVKCYKEKDNG